MSSLPPITRFTSLSVQPSTISTTNPGESGLFQVASMTTAQINALDATLLKNGSIVYDTTANKFKFYEDNGWVTYTPE